MALAQHTPPSSEEKAGTALLWFKNKAAPEWGLTVNEMTTLLGDMAPRTLHAYAKRAESGAPIKLGRDTYDRLSILLGIYAALALTAPSGSQSFFTRPYANSPLYGKSIKSALLDDNSLVSMYWIRRWLNAQRG